MGMTNSIWTFDPKHAIVQQYFSLPAPSSENTQQCAKDILSSPMNADSILIHPQFAIPSMAGDLCEASRVVVTLLAQLDLMADKQTADWEKFVIGQDEDTFLSMFGILDKCWQFLKTADLQNNTDTNSSEMLFFGVLLQSIFGLLQINIKNLPSKMFETQGVVLFAEQDVTVKNYFCKISQSLSRSIDADIGSNIVVRSNDREIALQVEGFHDDEDEKIFISETYAFANLSILTGDALSIDNAVPNNCDKLTLRLISNDLKKLDAQFRDAAFIKHFYVKPYFNKEANDILITSEAVLTLKPLRNQQIDFDDEFIKNTLKLTKSDDVLKDLPNLRFKIDSVLPTASSVAPHFIVNAEKCEITLDIKSKSTDIENV